MKPRAAHAQVAEAAHPTMGPREWGLLVGLSVLWGGSFFFIELALTGLTPLVIVWARVLLGALILGAWARVRGHPFPRTRRGWLEPAAMGALNNALPFILIVWGQTRITGGLAAILNATTPIWVVLLAHVFTTDERLRTHKLVGVGLGLVGVTLLIGPSALAGLGGEVAAQVAVLGAALSYAVAGVFGRRFRGQAPSVIAATSLGWATVYLTPLVLVLERPLAYDGGPVPLVALAGLTVLSTAVAYILYFRLLASAGATNALLVTFLIPVSAVLLGVLFLAETLGPTDLAGMGLILSGLLAVSGRRWGFARVR